MFPGAGAAVPVQEPGSEDDARQNLDATESGQDDSDSEGELMTLSLCMLCWVPAAFCTMGGGRKGGYMPRRSPLGSMKNRRRWICNGHRALLHRSGRCGQVEG